MDCFDKSILENSGFFIFTSIDFLLYQYFFAEPSFRYECRGKQYRGSDEKGILDI